MQFSLIGLSTSIIFKRILRKSNVGNLAGFISLMIEYTDWILLLKELSVGFYNIEFSRTSSTVFQSVN
jgi:hypothetical protein